MPLPSMPPSPALTLVLMLMRFLFMSSLSFAWMVRPRENGIKDNVTKLGNGGTKPPERDVNTSGGPHEPPD